MPMEYTTDTICSLGYWASSNVLTVSGIEKSQQQEKVFSVTV